MFQTSIAGQIATLTMSSPPVNALSEAAAALAEAKRCIAAAATPGRGGYGDELESTRNLQTDAETRERISAFIAGARS